MAISANDVWAVGYRYGRGLFKMHWDGTTWTNVGKREHTFLVAVDADQSDDVWAVSASGRIERWNGTSWKHLPSQSVHLTSVAVVSPDDVWLAGDDDALPPETPQAVILHWDGHDFTRVDLPDVGTASGFNGSNAASANDIWAVGGAAGARYGHPLIVHWDGSSWQVVSSPKITHSSSLRDVDALTADDVWAVGSAREHKFYPSTVTEHWDGRRWTRVD